MKAILFLKEHKFTFTIFVLIGILYFALRLPNLTLQPIFADEAIYIRWAQVMKAEPTLRFLPLSDGKTPLFMWIMMPVFKVFADPLLAGRVLSVFAGFATVVGAFLVSWKFFNPKVALWSAFLITITPWTLFFDRMALVDSMLAAFSLWSLFLALLVIKHQRLDLAMFLGFSLGLGMLTKTPGMFNLLVLPVTLVTLNWSDKSRQWKIVKIFGLLSLAFLIAFGMYNLLRLGPGFVSLSSRNQDYIFSPWELLGRPLDPFIPHMNDLSDWAPKLLTLPVILSLGLGVILAFIKRNKYIFAILLWGLIPLLIQSFLLKTFTARYLLSSIPPLLIIAGFGLDNLSQKIKVNFLPKIILMTVILAPVPFYTSYNLITQPEKVNLPRSERSGYFESWTAGYGFPKIAQFLMEEAKKGTVVVGTEGSFGTLPDGLMIYLDKHSHLASKENQILVIGGTATVSVSLKEAAKNNPTYFVANKSRFLGDESVQLLKEFPKAVGPKPQDAILFFRVLPPKR